jgi:glycosyltransferase involved in cell wall biosynthesis
MTVCHPKVSVIVPNYNHARFLRARVESVLLQTFRDFELILLDDCSTDDSQSILLSYAGNPHVRVEFNTANSGSTFKQWNKGVRLARGEYVWFAESDDYAAPRMLERLVEVLDTNPNAAFAYCRSWQVGADDDLNGFADSSVTDLDAIRWTADYCAEGKDECRKYFVYRNIVPNASAVLCRKAVYEAVGGADENLRLNGDWKLWASMALTGQVAYVGEPLNFFRNHNDSVRRRDRAHVSAAEESLEVVQWMLARLPVDDGEELREKISGLWLQAFETTHIPFDRARIIFQKARAIDPHAMRRLIFTIAFNFIGLPILNITRPVRHAFGLDQRGIRRLKRILR